MPLMLSSTYRFDRMPKAKIVSPVFRCSLFAKLLPIMQEVGS